jgi:hypothetical protein
MMKYLVIFVIITVYLSAFALLETTEGAANPNNVERGRIYMENNNTAEIWRTIQTYPNYAVSNLGRIKRLTSRTRAKAGHILKPVDRGNGYLCVTFWENKKKKNLSVHVLVAEAFLEKLTAEHLPNHKNGIRSDNRLENLEYKTQAENIQHSYANGFQKKEQNRGENNGQSKLTESDVLEILAIMNRERGEAGKVGKNYGVASRTISDIWNGKTWKHLS